MPNEWDDPDDFRNAWQNQEGEKMTLTAGEVRELATRFQRRIHWRNVREYLAVVLVVGGLIAQMVSIFHKGLAVWHLMPQLLGIAGAIYVAYQMHVRSSGRPVPVGAGLTESLAFHRGELERQRDAIRAVWRWYLAPLVPYFIAASAVAAIDAGGIDKRLFIRGAVGVILFVAGWKLNERAARRLDDKIRDLREMFGAAE